MNMYVCVHLPIMLCVLYVSVCASVCGGNGPTNGWGVELLRDSSYTNMYWRLDYECH